MLDPISVSVIARVFLIVGFASFWCHVSPAVLSKPAAPVSMLVAAASAAALLEFVKRQRFGCTMLNHRDEALCYTGVANLARYLAAGS